MPGILKVNSIQLAPGSTIMTMNNMQPGYILSSTAIRYGTRTALSISSGSVVFSGTFTKLQTSSTIFATCTVFGEAYYSGNCGVGMYVDSTSNWDYGTGYQYDGSWGAYQTTTVCGTGQWTGFSAGSHTIGWGWKCANGSATDRPFGYINPNSSTPSDNRNNQIISSIYVYEIAT